MAIEKRIHKEPIEFECWFHRWNNWTFGPRWEHGGACCLFVIEIGPIGFCWQQWRWTDSEWKAQISIDGENDGDST